ncbi:hypothetical protein PsorP6_006460 [Peronosclerospora sorghi]|uniref:Uncharacterized protein n=1 Tax=Peronosclerospora sorghi TaxID=230839 RepID=A0ACC0W578_9STRA|nr:hypothetical protein PsorP6_006460 [Peronosclerospora sorghi]
MIPRLSSSAAAALRRRQDPKLMEKFNLASLNGGKSPFVVLSNSLLKVKNQAPCDTSEFSVGTLATSTQERKRLET